MGNEQIFHEVLTISIFRQKSFIKINIILKNFLIASDGEILNRKPKIFLQLILKYPGPNSVLFPTLILKDLGDGLSGYQCMSTLEIDKVNLFNLELEFLLLVEKGISSKG